MVLPITAAYINTTILNQREHTAMHGLPVRFCIQVRLHPVGDSFSFYLQCSYLSVFTLYISPVPFTALLNGDSLVHLCACVGKSSMVVNLYFLTCYTTNSRNMYIN